MVYFIQLIILLLALVNCGDDGYIPNISDHIKNIKIPYFSKEAEKCNSGSNFDLAPDSSRTLLQQCHDVESAFFQECKDKAREACQKVAVCTKNKFLEYLFYDQNELKSKLETVKTETELIAAVTEMLSPSSGPPIRSSNSQCLTSETLEFQSFVSTHRVKEDVQ